MCDGEKESMMGTHLLQAMGENQATDSASNNGNSGQRNLGLLLVGHAAR